jgi:hypothetical protein
VKPSKVYYNKKNRERFLIVGCRAFKYYKNSERKKMKHWKNSSKERYYLHIVCLRVKKTLKERNNEFKGEKDFKSEK